MSTTSLLVQTSGRGLIEITAEVAALVDRVTVDDGLCTLFVQHTSAGSPACWL